MCWPTYVGRGRIEGERSGLIEIGFGDGRIATDNNRVYVIFARNHDYRRRERRSNDVTAIWMLRYLTLRADCPAASVPGQTTVFARGRHDDGRMYRRTGLLSCRTVLVRPRCFPQPQ